MSANENMKTHQGWRREFLATNCWQNDYGWPRQVILRIEHRGVDYLLYLRLRGHYWEGYVIRGSRSLSDLSLKVTCWSCDLLRYHWLRYEEHQLVQAKQALAGIFQHRYGRSGQLAALSNQIVTLA